MSISRPVLLCTLTILLALVALWPSFDTPGMPMDEGSLLVYPELISKGALPYRDFETFYAPANLWVLSGVYAVFSPNVFVERSVGLAYRVLILLALFLIGRRWDSFLGAGCTFLAGVLLIPGFLQAHAWLGAIACALWSILLLSSVEDRGRTFLAGALAGASLLFRQDLGPAIILSAIPLLLPKSGRARLHYLGGFILAMLPLAWLAFAVGPREILNNLFLFPVIYSNPGRHLPILSAERQVLALFYLHLLAIAASVVVGALGLIRNRSDIRSRLLLALGLLGLGLTHQVVQRLDLIHVTYAAIVSVSLLPVSVVVLLRWKKEEGKAWFRDVAFAFATVVVVIGIISPEEILYFRSSVVMAVTGDYPCAVFVTAHGRSFPISPKEEAVFLTRMLRKLEESTLPGQRLFVGPTDLRRTNLNDTFLYHLLPELRPATYFLEMNPGSANRSNSRLASDIATADWLVLDHLLDFVDEDNKSAKMGSDLPVQVVLDRFELCGRFGPWVVYRKKAAAAAQQNRASIASKS